MAKATSSRQDEEDLPLYNHCLDPANAIAYIRLGFLTGGWVSLSCGAPVLFFMQYAAQMMFSFMELGLFTCHHNPELQKQLRNVLDTMSFGVIMFAVVSSAEMSPSTGRSEVDTLTLLHFLVFMSDFVSTWFHNYSTYLAGERPTETKSAIENLITAPWENPLCRIAFGLFSEGFFLYEFVDFNIASFLVLSEKPDQKSLQEVFTNRG